MQTEETVLTLNLHQSVFAKCDIIRIQKNKYGFVDRKLKPVTPIEFDKATDFENNLAVVSKGINSFIN